MGTGTTGHGEITVIMVYSVPGIIIRNMALIAWKCPCMLSEGIPGINLTAYTPMANQVKIDATHATTAPVTVKMKEPEVVIPPALQTVMWDWTRANWFKAAELSFVLLRFRVFPFNFIPI